MDSAILARLVHRLAMDDGWVPLVRLDAALVPLEERDRALSDAVGQAQGGFLHLQGAWPNAAAEEGARLLRDSGPPLAVSPGAVVTLRRVDALHAVATDPGLLGVRRLLTRLVRGTAPILLRGPVARTRPLVELLHAWFSGPAPLVGFPADAIPTGAWVVADTVCRPVLPELEESESGLPVEVPPAFILEDDRIGVPTPGRQPAVVEVGLSPLLDARPRTNAVLLALDGRAMETALLRALCDAPARGAAEDVLLLLNALLAACPGTLTLAAAQSALPAAFPGPPPMVLETLAPGGVALVEPDAEWVVVGRVRTREELVAAVLPTDAARIPALREVLAGATLECLALDATPELSRIHLLFHRRSDGGLEAWMISPRLEARVQVDGGAWRALPAGDVARATKTLRVELGGGAVALLLARDRAAHGALAVVVPTRAEVVVPEAPAPAGEVTEEEVDALHGLLLRWPGENLPIWLREELSSPEMRRSLGSFGDRLAASRRPDRRLGAWYAAHASLREGLLERLASSSSPAAARARLPAPVRKALEEG